MRRRPSSRPDYLLEGRVFDCYSPTRPTKNARGIWSEVEEKVVDNQTQRVVVNLESWRGDLATVHQQFGDWPIAGLKELKAIMAKLRANPPWTFADDPVVSVRDYLTGMFVVLEDQYGVGDEIDTGVATGTVEWVSLRMTRLRDADGVAWHVPNGEIKRVANFSQRLPSEGQHDATRDRDLEDDSGAAAADEGPNPQDEGRRGDR